MASFRGDVRQRGPRRARYLIPKDMPRRREVLAGCYLALLLAHVLFAQAAAVIAAVFVAVTQLARFRRSWLGVPLAVGVIWVLALGPADAAERYLTGPRQILGYLGGAVGDPGRLAHPGRAFADWPSWLMHQVPYGLVLGSLEAAVATWLAWLHTDGSKLAPPRPGLVVVTRRFLATRGLRGGGVVTKNGACLGVNETTGERVTLTWREVGAGVLCLGAAGTGTSTTCFQVVYAAIRRRRPVIALDLAGNPSLVERFRTACAATDTPFHLFTPAGPDWYEPMGTGDAARRRDLVMSMVDWHGAAEQYRRGCARYLQDVFAVLDVAPGDPSVSVLDEVVHLLDPAALQARAARIPVYHPNRSSLQERTRVSANLVTADPQTVAALTGALQEVQASVVGHFLHPSTGRRIDLERIIRDRAVVLFSLDSTAHGRPAAKVANLVARDVVGLAGELRRMGVDGDGLVCVDGYCDLDQDVVAGLLDRGREAGLPAILSAGSADSYFPAERLMDLAGVYVIHRMNDPTAAEKASRLAGDVPGIEDGPGSETDTGMATGAGRRPVVAPEAIQGLSDGRFVLIVKSPRHRVVSSARTVPAQVPAPTRASPAPELPARP